MLNILYHLSLFIGCIGAHCVADEHKEHNGLLILNILAIIDSGYSIWNQYRSHKVLFRAPTTKYIPIGVLYAIIMYINTNAWKYAISLSYQVIIRSCSLLINISIGKLIFGIGCGYKKIIASVCITIGLLLVSWESLDGDESNIWSIGLTIILISMILSAIMGNMQSKLYKEYDCNYNELIFMTHIISLPFYMTDLTFDLSSMKYGILQYMCIKSVYIIHNKTNSYHLTIMLTIRKLISIMISDIYYGTDFSEIRWTGIIMVFISSIWALY